MIDKGLLDGMEAPLGIRQTFDGHHALPFYLQRREDTGVDGSPVQEDCAGSTLPHAAPFFRACQFQLVPQQLEQRKMGFDLHLNPVPI